MPPQETVAVLGNWEHLSGVDLKTLRQVYALHGVRLLVNECHRGFVGLDDHSVGVPDLRAAQALWTPRGSGCFITGEYPSAYGPLYVTRGIGTSLVPVRFGARPEIVFVSFAGPDTRG